MQNLYEGMSEGSFRQHGKLYTLQGIVSFKNKNVVIKIIFAKHLWKNIANYILNMLL